MKRENHDILASHVLYNSTVRRLDKGDFALIPTFFGVRYVKTGRRCAQRIGSVIVYIKTERLIYKTYLEVKFRSDKIFA